MPVDIFDTLEEEKPRDIFDEVESVSEESTPPEREPYVTPPRAPAPDMSEFSRGTPENPYGVATPEQRAFTAAQPSEFDRPLIPPGVFKTALDIGSATLPRTELLEGFKEGTAEQLAGMTSQSSAAMLPAFAIPYVGPALAMGMGAKAVGAGAGTVTGALEGGNLREAGSGLSEVAGGALMIGGGAMAARPAIPPRIVEAIAKADQVGLTKSAQALADKTKRDAVIDIAARVEPVETIKPTEVTDARNVESAATPDGDLLTPPVEGQPAVPVAESGARIFPREEPAIAREPARAQGGEEGQILLTGPEVIKSIIELPDAEAGSLKQKPAVEAGMKLTEADVPALEAARDAAMQRAVDFAEAGNNEAFKANFGRNIWFSGAIEGARRKGPNYDVFIKEQSTPAAPTPEAVPAGPVGGEPVGRSVVGAAKPSVFREASAQDVDSYVNPSTDASTPFGTPEIHVSTSRDLALGQGKNKSGIIVELDPSQLDIAPPKRPKPGAEFVEQQGGGVEQIIRAQPSALRDKVRSVTVPKALGLGTKDPSDIRLRRYLDQNWNAEPSGDTIVYQPKPAAATTPAIPVGRPAVAGAGVPAQVKQPWEMSRAEFSKDYFAKNPTEYDKVMRGIGVNPDRLHSSAVNRAAREGRTIPEFNQKYVRPGTLAEAPKTETTPAQLPQTEISGAGAPPIEPPTTPPTAPGAPTPPPPGTPRATLDDVYKIFEPAPKKGQTLGERASGALESFRTGFSSKFRPLNKLAEDVASAVGGTAKDVAGIFEQLKGSSGKAEADVYRFDKDVSDAVKGSEKDFNAYVFLRRSLDRLQQDAADIARAQAGENVPKLNRRKVSQYTIPELEAKLTALSEQIGGERLANFDRAAEAYQTHMDQALRLQVESGRMSPEVYDAIKDGNQFYAPFKVMKYIEESMRPEGSGGRVDTAADYVKAMEGIEDPNFKLGDMLAAARQNLTLSRTLAEKNRAMQNITELAALDVDGNFVRKLKPGEDAPSGMEAVNVMENGQKQRYAVNENVAQAVQNAGPGLPAGIVARWSSNLFRAGATTLNLAFQPVNLIAADAPRAALVSKYGVKGVTDLVRYPMDFVESLFSSIAGDVFGVQNKLFQDFLDSGAAGTTVQQYLTPEALRFKPATVTSQAKGIGQTILNTVPQFANAIEQTSKVLGVKRAMRIEGKESGAQLAREIPEAITEIRRFSGSPDFGRSGKWTDQYRLNLVYMFLNARIQGGVADVGRLAGRDGASTAGKTWLKVGTAVGIPTAYLYLLNNSEEYKKDYDQRPEQEKQNYWLIPKDTFITGSNGEKIRDYWRVPKREIAQWMGNAVESGMDFANQRDPKAFWKWAEGMAESISPLNIRGNTLQERAESVVSGTHPFIKAPIELATGRDTYRHRNIVPDSQRKASPEQQYTDRTAEVFKSLGTAMPDVAPEVFRSPLMLENVTKNFTAGLFTQFLPRQPVEGRSKAENLPLAQRFQALPYTDSSEFDQRIQKFERESADEQLKRLRDAKAIMDGNKGAKPDVLIEQMIEKHGRDPKLAERIVDLYLAEQRGITPQERRVLALPVTQRAEYLADELNGKTPEQKAALLRNWALKRILTERVGAELAPRLAP